MPSSPRTISLCLAPEVTHVLFDGLSWYSAPTEGEAHAWLARVADGWPARYHLTERIDAAAPGSVFDTLLYYARSKACRLELGHG